MTETPVKETGPDIHSVYMTVAADLVISQVCYVAILKLIDKKWIFRLFDPGSAPIVSLAPKNMWLFCHPLEKGVQSIKAYIRYSNTRFACMLFGYLIVKNSWSERPRHCLVVYG